MDTKFIVSEVILTRHKYSWFWYLRELYNNLDHVFLSCLVESFWCFKLQPMLGSPMHARVRICEVTVWAYSLTQYAHLLYNRGMRPSISSITGLFISSCECSVIYYRFSAFLHLISLLFFMCVLLDLVCINHVSSS